MQIDTNSIVEEAKDSDTVVTCTYCKQLVSGPTMKVDVSRGIIQAKGALGEHFETCSYFREYSKRLKHVAKAAAGRALHNENHVLQSQLAFGLKENDAIESCFQVSTAFTANQNEVREFMNEWKATKE
jgi:hypothetical protein